MKINEPRYAPFLTWKTAEPEKGALCPQTHSPIIYHSLHKIKNI